MASEQSNFPNNDSSRKKKKTPTTNILDKAPPFDLAAEMGILGSLILNPDVATELALELRASDFFDDAHRKLYTAMMNLYETGRKMDVEASIKRRRVDLLRTI